MYNFKLHGLKKNSFIIIFSNLSNRRLISIDPFCKSITMHSKSYKWYD